jgi:hypothetical protein
MKPGWKTTEFWMSLAAAAMGATLASGVIPSESPWVKVLSVPAMALASLGYSYSRGKAKGNGGS